MDYYLGVEGRSATFIIRDGGRRTVARAVGQKQGDTPLFVERPSAANPAGYPMYELITVNGVTEVIEHRRMEPIFYITDDPVVKQKLGVQ